MGFSIKAMWNNKCPRCRQGDIFVKPFELKKPLNMPDRCSLCGQRTEPEPGFYFGAMFLSYILSAWFLILPTLFLIFVVGWTVEASMAVTIGLGALTYLKFLRGSRSLWLHLMVKHDPKMEEEVRQKLKEEDARSWKPNLGNHTNS